MFQMRWVVPLLLVFLKTAPAGAIAGRVQSKDHAPVPALVTALRLDFYGEEKHYNAVRSIKTREDGTYSILGVARGKYYVVADPLEQKSPVPPGEGVRRGLQPTYYPSADSPENSLPVVVDAEGEASAIEITLSEADVYSVCGTVEWAVEPRTISLILVPLAQDQHFVRSVALEAHRAGGFCFERVAIGEYAVEAKAETGGVTGKMIVSVTNRDLRELKLTVYPAASIEGLLHAERRLDRQGIYASMAAPVAIFDADGLLVSLMPNPDAALLPTYARLAINGIDGQASMQVRLEAVEQAQEDAAAVQAGSGGKFTLSGLPFGRYRVAVENVPLGFFVKSIRYGGKEVPGGEIEVAVGSPGQLDILLSGDAVFIRGIVTDGAGNAVSGAPVSLLADSLGDAPPLVARTTVSREDGRFAFWNLAPGGYRAWAWRELEPAGLATRPTFVRAFSNRAVRIEAINPGDASYTVRLDAVPREHVARGGW